MDLKPGSLVVLEGMDKTGKSTQRRALEGLFPDVHYTHQPSGGTMVGELVYQITEQVRDLSPVARQFLHLASHAEHYQRELVPTLSNRAVVMDRCWWSTVAYGWFAGGIRYLCDLEDFLHIAKLPTQGIAPSIVFLFTHAYESDHHNTPELLQGYLWLAEHAGVPRVARVPIGSPQHVTNWIVAELEAAGLVVAE